MRSSLLSLIALLAFGVAPAGAQPVVQAGPGKVVTGPPSLPSVEPASPSASNISGADTRSVIAPALPPVNLPPNATAADYLRAAQSALAAGQTGRAQSALENAETLLLTRSVPLGATGAPDQNPAIGNIESALNALAANNIQAAMGIVQQTIPMAGQGRPPAPPGPPG
ncbi:MAG TPA: hypothetical protein VMU81_17525 [Acetobacteraceae bacterium]|jgi:hypothetical protein|nr:hypothetical protein [Acetobacteraceae bacterium]